ncbi:hypothetical protein JW758_05575 [Candidatus Peregrinibacteria bacterium]|nr:hypothetical protein [Candidatus Peregrinibacteria bacterium]
MVDKNKFDGSYGAARSLERVKRNDQTVQLIKTGRKAVSGQPVEDLIEVDRPNTEGEAVTATVPRAELERYVRESEVVQGNPDDTGIIKKAFEERGDMTLQFREGPLAHLALVVYKEYMMDSEKLNAILNYEDSDADEKATVKKLILKALIKTGKLSESAKIDSILPDLIEEITKTAVENLDIEAVATAIGVEMMKKQCPAAYLAVMECGKGNMLSENAIAGMRDVLSSVAGGIYNSPHVFKRLQEIIVRIAERQTGDNKESQRAKNIANVRASIVSGNPKKR